MAVVNQVFVDVVSQVIPRYLHEPRNLGGTQSTTILPSLIVASVTSSSATAASSTMSSNQGSQGGNSGPTSSPLLFFVALGFGVVFTNLWCVAINRCG